MICIARIFGAPVIEPPGKAACEHVERTGVRVEGAADHADQVVHVGIALQGAEFFHAHAPGAARACQVVAHQVDDHHVFGVILFRGEQAARAWIRSVSGVLPRRRVPLIGRVSTCAPVTRTKRSGEKLSTAVASSPWQERRERRGGARAQVQVSRPRITVAGCTEALGKVDLVAVTVAQIALHACECLRHSRRCRNSPEWTVEQKRCCRRRQRRFERGEHAPPCRLVDCGSKQRHRAARS
jgi:hypothetical protein